MKLKLITVTSLVFLFSILSVALIVTFCHKKTSSPAPVVCAVSGTPHHVRDSTVNVDVQTTTGNVADCELCSGRSSRYDAIAFDNIAFVVYIGDTWNSCSCPGGRSGTIMDVGPQSCPGFTYASTPAAEAVAYTVDHGYVGIFPDGYLLRLLQGLSIVGSPPHRIFFSD